MSEKIENLDVDTVVENCEVNDNQKVEDISENIEADIKDVVENVGESCSEQKTEKEDADREAEIIAKADSVPNPEIENIINILGEIASKKQELEKELNDKKEYLTSNLMKYDSENYFQNESFKNLYKEAFNALGTKLDTDKFVNLIDDYVESRILANDRKLIADKENNDLTDSMNFSSGESKKQERTLRMQDIPDDELEKYIAKYV